MKEEIFKQKYLKGIKSVLDFALKNPYSDFYRKKYEGLGLSPESINSFKDFQKIPTLTKEEISAVGVGRRIFVPKNQVLMYVLASEAVNSQEKTIIPQSAFVSEYGINEEELAGMGVTKLLMLLSPISTVKQRTLANYKKQIALIMTEFKDMPLTAEIVVQLNFQGILTTPTALCSLIKQLEGSNFDTAAIKWISLVEEYCSPEKLNFLKSVFTNARFNSRYLTTEVGDTIGYKCSHLESSFYEYHLLAHNNLLEIANDGEMIYTDLHQPKAFPLIRYRTMDIGWLKEQRCKCGQDSLLVHKGRKTPNNV